MTALAENADDAAETPAARCAAELVESSDGWHLTLRLASADALTNLVGNLTGAAQVGLHRQTAGDLTVRISPNLVPGHPFALADIHVIVDEPEPKGT